MVGLPGGVGASIVALVLSTASGAPARVVECCPPLLALWTRRWWLYGPIGAWFAVNPVITPPIRDTSSFATRAILGEESWSRNPTSEPVVLALSGVASASLVGAMVAAYQRRKAGAVIGTGVFMALTLWEWELWADRFARDSSRTGA